MNCETLWGAPKEWQLSEDDERLVRGFLQEMGPYAADVEKRSAVLVATEDDGELVGAWNRDGAAWLAGTIKVEAARGRWVEVWQALEDGVTGP